MNDGHITIITTKMIEAWVGNLLDPAVACEFMIGVLRELACGEYTIQELGDEILRHAKRSGIK
jgi:hypothetical protein